MKRVPAPKKDNCTLAEQQKNAVGMQKNRCIYIDKQHEWWLAEPISGNPSKDDIKIVEKFDENAKNYFIKADITSYNRLAPCLLYFDDNTVVKIPLKRQKVLGT